MTTFRNMRGEQLHESPEAAQPTKDFLTPEKVTFDEGNYTLLLDLDARNVDVGALTEWAAKRGLMPKDAFHITILGFKVAKELKRALKALPEAQRPDALLRIKTLVEQTDWRLSFRPERYYVAKEYVNPDPKNKDAFLRERRESLVQMVDMPGMEQFYRALNDLLSTTLEAPPAHVTLYTGGDDAVKSKMGIGINSQAEFQQLNPELITL
jgi:hypothetical protein